MTDLRAFSSKKQKTSAAEIRRQLVESSNLFGTLDIETQQLSCDKNLAKSSKSLLLDQCLLSNEIATPVDVEEVLSSRQIKRLEVKLANNWIQRIADYNDCDVSIRPIPRERVFLPNTIAAIANGNVKSHIRDFVFNFEKDYVVVDRNYRQYSNEDALERLGYLSSQLAITGDKQVFESDIDADIDKQLAHRSVSQIEDPSTKRFSSLSADFDSHLKSINDKLSNMPSDPMLISNSNHSTLFDNHFTTESFNQGKYLVSLLPDQLKTTTNKNRFIFELPSILPTEFLSVQFQSMRMEPYFEPIFACAYFIDLQTKSRLTENFYFDFNTREMLGLIRVHLGIDEQPFHIREALLNAEHFGSNVFLIIRMEKILQASDCSDAIEPYIAKDKTQEKLIYNARVFCERLGAYRMPIGWNFIELKTLLQGPQRESEMQTFVRVLAHSENLQQKVSDACKLEETSSVSSKNHGQQPDSASIISADRLSGSTNDTLYQGTVSASTVISQGGSSNDDNKQSVQANVSVDSETQNFYRKLATMTSYRHTINSMFKSESEKLSDNDICKVLIDYQKAGTSRLTRLKSFPVEMSLEMSIRRSDEINDFLSTELLPAADFVPDTGDKAREVLVFPQKQIFNVHSFYRNLLYIYPKNVNFNGRSGNFRNITCRVELLNSVHESHEKVFFGKSCGPKMLNKVYTSIVYHNKTPQFADEIKAAIPVDIDDGHYLLFTFFHISCKTNKQTDAVETPIGYTWYPLYMHNELQTGHKNLPISLEPPPQGMTYVSPSHHVPNIKWLDNHKELFEVSFVSVSTVHPEDSHLTEFFRCFHSIRANTKGAATEQELQNSIKNLTKASPEKLSAYLYVIFDKLIALITSPFSVFTENLSATCFDVLSQLIKLSTVLFDGKTDSNSRCALLSNYIFYHRLTGNDSFTGPEQALKGMSGQISARDSESLIRLIKKYEQSSSTKMLTNADESLDSNKRLVHEEFARLFVKMSQSQREHASTYAWFFTELINKSVIEYLSTWDRFVLPRKLRLSDGFMENVNLMCEILLNEIIERASKNLTQADSINTALAYFISDAFATMDRTFLINQIRRFSKTMVDKICEATEPLQTTLMTLKLSFLRIVCSHEHFVILNLPFEFQLPQQASLLASFKSSISMTGISSAANTPTTAFPSTIPPAPPSPSGSSSLSSKSSHTLDLELNTAYRAKHFLCGIVLNDLAVALNSTNTIIHTKAIELISSLLMTHEMDERLNDNNAWLKSKLTLLYLPLITIIMDARSSLHDPFGQRSAASNASSSQSSGRLLDPKVAGSIAGLDRLPIEHNAVAGLSKMHLKQSGTLSKQLTKELLACFCWVLKNIDRPVLFNFLLELQLQRIQQFVDLLQLCVSIFEYKPPTESFSADLSAETRRHSNSALEELGTIRGPKMSNTGLPPTCGSSIRWRKNADLTLSRHSTLATNNFTQNTETSMDRELSTEVSLTLLDALTTVVKVITLPELDHFLFILPNVFRALMHMLKCNQSVKALESIFVVQRAFVSKFPGLIFEQQSGLCSELCLELLRYMGCKQQAIRAQAASSLYLLMRQSFEHSLNFSKLKMQITMALSTLVSSVGPFGLLNEDNIRHSLKAIISYLKHDTTVDQSLRISQFSNQITTTVFNLSTIVMDTFQLKTYSDDFEMFIDLLYRIAKGYQNNPDLRLTWLLNISQKHMTVQNYAEAAQCLLHASALSCEYMSMRNLNDTIPNGASAFKTLSLNVDDECALEDIVAPEEEGICESTYFTADGFLHLIDKTADLFEKSMQFELVPKLYKLAQPILEHQRNFGRLARVHARISNSLQKVETPLYYNENNAVPSLLPTDKRCFGTYFRVGFYGYKFGDLNGSEFVYKEPFFTKLPEISHRLEAFYTAQMGKDSVEVIKDSNDFDPRQLDQNKGYLQITYVDPYFDVYEKRRRTTHLDLNYGINRFVYYTPFTKHGQAHGSLENQYKKRTILSTKHCFPYLKTRIRVIAREQLILSPIEVAIEDLQKKTNELCAATKIEPPDSKMLQMLLQGCIGTTVNQGPIEIARVFLSQVETNEHGKPVDVLQNRLRICFKDFSKKCADALQKNETLITVDQQEYQKELKRNFFEFTQQLAQIIAGPVYSADLMQKLHLNSRADRTLPINLHAFTAQVISAGVGRISSV